jgi:hypothetical protein
MHAQQSEGFAMEDASVSGTPKPGEKPAEF